MIKVIRILGVAMLLLAVSSNAWAFRTKDAGTEKSTSTSSKAGASVFTGVKAGGGLGAPVKNNSKSSISNQTTYKSKIGFPVFMSSTTTVTKKFTPNTPKPTPRSTRKSTYNIISDTVIQHETPTRKIISLDSYKLPPDILSQDYRNELNKSRLIPTVSMSKYNHALPIKAQRAITKQK